MLDKLIVTLKRLNIKPDNRRRILKEVRSIAKYSFEKGIESANAKKGKAHVL